MIVVDGVTFAYGRTTVLDDVSFTARSGHVVGLIGPNGSGKTTLLRTLHAALEPRAGTVLVDSAPVHRLPDRERARRIAVVAQERNDQLGVRVLDLVLLGRSPHRHSLQPYTGADHELAARALRLVGLELSADRELAGLSGGEKQRASIARALVQEADHLLLDEPTNHLDVRFQHEVLGLVRGLGATTVVVLHDLNLAARYCDDLVLLDRGRVVAAGPTSEVLTPAVLEPVYEVGVAVVDHGGFPHLLLTPTRAPVPVAR